MYVYDYIPTHVLHGFTYIESKNTIKNTTIRTNTLEISNFRYMYIPTSLNNSFK